MTRRLAAPVGILAAGVFLLGPAGPAGAQETPLPRQAFLFLVDRVSFEEVLAVPQFRALARSGGAGLASFRPLPGDRGLGPYLTIGAGAQAEVPMSRLAPGGDGVSSLDLGLIERANDTATPGLLATSLLERGRSSALYGNDDDRFGPNVPGALVAMDRQGRVRGSDEGATLPAPTELGAVRTNGEALLRRFVTDRARGIRSDLVVFDLGDTHRVNEEAPYAAPGVAAAARAAALRSAGRFVERAVRASDSPQVLVVVATPGTSIDMRRVGDAVTPMIVARGEPDRLFPRSGATHALTSSSTRHAGVVAEDDVAPTILSFLGVPVPAEMTGAPIERLAEPAPFDLHRRHLEHRRIRVPAPCWRSWPSGSGAGCRAGPGPRPP